MHIDIANTRSGKTVAFDECTDLLIGGLTRCRQVVHQAQDAVAVPKTAKRQFTDDEWVSEDLPS